MHFYVHLVDTKFTKWSNFVREAWLIKEKWNKRSCLEPPMNADARRCSVRLIGVHRRFPTLGGMRSLAIHSERSSYRPVFHRRDTRATMASWHGRPGHDTKLDRFANFVSTKWTWFLSRNAGNHSGSRGARGKN